MKVRIRSGNEKGVVKDLPQIEAENVIATGFAELVDEKDQAELDKNVAGVPVPDVPKKEAKRLVKNSPAATPSKGRTGKKVPQPTGKKAPRK
jgi:hypothetical protein